MATHISRSPEDTLELGRAWGRDASAGLVITLDGELGAGKTQLVRGIAAGLGFPGRVHSPTFALVNEYPGGRLPLAHLDLYRLEGAAALRSAGLEEYVCGPAGVVVVEWFDRWLDAALPAPGGHWRRVRLGILGEREREIVYEDSGP